VSVQIHHGDLLFIQVCSDPTPMHCNIAQGKMYSPTMHCYFVKQAHSRLVSLQCHYEDLLFVPVCSHPTPMHCSIAQRRMPRPLFSAALHYRYTYGDSQKACVIIGTPTEICCSYRWAVTQQQCTAALLKAKCNLHCFVLQCK